MMETLALTHIYLACETPLPAPGWRKTEASDLAIFRAAGIGMTASVFALSTLATSEAIAVVKRGNTCDAVKNVQQALIDRGHDSGGVDGVFGGKTQYAVIKFQQRNTLAADGIVGPATAKALGLSGTDYNAGSLCSGERTSQGNGDRSSSNNPATRSVTVSTQGSRLNVRTQPDAQSNIIRKLNNGAGVSVTGQSRNGWIELTEGGWVASQWIAQTTPRDREASADGISVTVSTRGSQLNVRSEPNTSASITRKLKNGTLVATSGRAAGTWLELAEGGWVSSRWVK